MAQPQATVNSEHGCCSVSMGNRDALTLDAPYGFSPHVLFNSEYSLTNLDNPECSEGFCSFVADGQIVALREAEQRFGNARGKTELTASWDPPRFL